MSEPNLDKLMETVVKLEKILKYEVIHKNNTKYHDILYNSYKITIENIFKLNWVYTKQVRLEWKIELLSIFNITTFQK